MKNNIFLFVFFFLISSFSFSQSALITCSTKSNPDRSVSIYANCQANAEYTVKLIFSSYSGYTSRSFLNSNVALVTINRGYMEIMKLIPDNSINPSLQYKYQYFPGRAFKKMPDTTFEYLLPASSGKKLQVTRVSSQVSSLFQQTGVNIGTEYRGTGFLYSPGDTICASRAGIVFECSDTLKTPEKTETVFMRGRNRISIEHRDGTLGIYGVLSPIKLLVKTGDEVFPGQPLAVFNSNGEKYIVLFSTCYLDEKKLLSDNSYDNSRPVHFIYMPTHFYADENDRLTKLQVRGQYTVQHPNEIITAEMSKKEKKKFEVQ